MQTALDAAVAMLPEPVSYAHLQLFDPARYHFIQPSEDPEGLPHEQTPALYVNLMPKDQDLRCQRSSRTEQPDQRRPNKAAHFPHRTETLRDSASAVSPIRFTTGTAERETASACIHSRRQPGHPQVQRGRARRENYFTTFVVREEAVDFEALASAQIEPP
jgi:hypothetical protein